MEVEEGVFALPAVTKTKRGSGVSDDDKWTQDQVINKVHLDIDDWSGWKWDAGKKAQDYKKLVKQVEEFERFDHVKAMNQRMMMAYGLPDNVKVLIMTPCVGKKEAQHRKLRHEEGGAGVIFRKMAKQGVNPKHIMISSVVPYEPGNQWGRKEGQKAWSTTPPPYIERIFSFYARQLIRIVRPTWIIVLNGDMAEIMLRLQNIKNYGPGDMKSYVEGSQDKQKSAGGGRNFDSIRAHQVYQPLGITARLNVKVLRLYNTWYMENNLGPAENERQAQLIKEVADLLKEETEGGKKKVKNAFALLMGRDEEVEEDHPAKKPRLLTVQEVKLWYNMLILTSPPVDDKSRASLVDKRGYTTWINMCSNRIALTPKQKREGGGIHQVFVPIEQFKNSYNRWVPETLEQLCGEVLEAWGRGNRVAVFCNDSIHESSLLACCLQVYLYPDVTVDEAKAWIQDVRKMDDCLSSKDLECLINFYRQICLSNLPKFRGLEPGWDYTIWAAFKDGESWTHVRICHLPNWPRAKAFRDYFWSKLRMHDADTWLYCCTEDDTYYQVIDIYSQETPDEFHGQPLGRDEALEWIQENGPTRDWEPLGMKRTLTTGLGAEMIDEEMFGLLRNQ